MALNLLDSLSTSSAPTEKNSFSSKTKADGDADATDFGQLLQDLMPGLKAKELGLSPGDSTESSDKDTAIGQELATTDSHETDTRAACDSALLLSAGLAPAVPQHLSAWVLSPNMTAITASPAAPDSGSLSAFAKAQGLDEAVAAWLLTAGQGKLPTDKTAVAGDKTTLVNAAPAVSADQTSNSLPLAPMALDSLHSGMRAVSSMAIGSAPSEDTATVSMPIVPLSMPASWWTQRLQGAGKAAAATPASTTPGTSKSTAHASELDLTLVFAETPDRTPTPSAGSATLPFTPAAWLMPGGTPGNDASTTSLVKVLNDASDNDLGRDHIDGSSALNPERSPATGKPAETSLSSNTKAFESSLTTAQRSEAQLAQAEKMGQAIGQRMLSEMEKGHWHLKMMLRPANLGHIEVEMRLRNGELDAHFTASQAGTRDLLQDGLPKLKDTLTQMGMDVASMNIGGGSSQKNGGDPTPQQSRPLATATPESTEHPQEQTKLQQTRISASGQDGLDVMV